MAHKIMPKRVSRSMFMHSQQLWLFFKRLGTKKKSLMMAHHEAIDFRRASHSRQNLHWNTKVSDGDQEKAKKH